MFDVEAVRNLLIAIAGLLIIIVGMRIVGRSGKADYGEVARTSMNAIIGIVFVAAGAGAIAIAAFGKSILDFLGIGSGS